MNGRESASKCSALSALYFTVADSENFISCSGGGGVSPQRGEGLALTHYPKYHALAEPLYLTCNFEAHFAVASEPNKILILSIYLIEKIFVILEGF